MAIVQLKDVKCVGTFSKGFRVVEESTSRDGRTFTTRWTVWDTSLGVNEGDVVSLSGFLSAKVGEWTDRDGQVRHSVDLALNSPRLSGEGSQQGQGGSSGSGWHSDVGGPVSGAQAGAGGFHGSTAETPF